MDIEVLGDKAKGVSFLVDNTLILLVDSDIIVGVGF